MEHLTAAQLAELRRLLEAERAQLRVRHASEDDDANTVQLEPGDIQDRASEEARRTIAMQRREHDDGRINEVEAALRRMDEGEYGVCEETDDPIPYARLLAEPTTRYTVEAQEEIERQAGRDVVSGHPPEDSEAY